MSFNKTGHPSIQDVEDKLSAIDLDLAYLTKQRNALVKKLDLMRDEGGPISRPGRKRTQPIDERAPIPLPKNERTERAEEFLMAENGKARIHYREYWASEAALKDPGYQLVAGTMKNALHKV